MNKQTFKRVWDEAFAAGVRSVNKIIVDPEVPTEELVADSEAQFAAWFKAHQEEEI